MTPESPSPRSSWKNIVRWAGTLLSIGLFIWLIARQDWGLVLEKTAGIELWAPLAGTVLFIGSTLLNVCRWFVYLRGADVRVSYGQAMRLAWASYFASNFLPSTVGGDTVRMLAMLVYTGNKAVAFGSVILDRVTNMVAMACLLPVSGVVIGASHIGIAVVGAFPGWLRKTIDGLIAEVKTAARTWIRRPGTFLLAFLVAWPSNLLPMFATYLIARQLGMEVTYGQVIGVQTLTYFISVLPISISGYGVREVAYATFYVALGASIEQASTLALITRFFMMIVTLPGAIWVGESIKIARSSREAQTRN